MDNLIKIEYENFELHLKSLESDTKKIEEKFNNINCLMNKIIHGDNIWIGKTATVVEEKYTKLYNKFPKIINQLNNYNDFLKYTIENYKMLDCRIKENINNNDDNLDITGE